MSLINKMLQDLDARRFEVTGPEYDAQIRAVPARRRFHRAWWVALLLAAGIGGGVLAWQLLRPAPVSIQGKLALRPLPAPQAIQAAPPPTVIPESEVAPAQPTPVVEQSADAKPAAPTAVPVKPKPPAPVAPKESRPTPKPQLAAAPEVKQASPAPVAANATSSETAAPAALNKQVKELTPAQRADNDYRKAAMLMQQGRAVEAQATLERVLQLDPHHAAARQTLVATLLESRRNDDALRVAREGLNINAAQPGLAMIVARLQVEKSELRAAIETLERTLQFASERGDYQSFLAALLQRAGRNKEAAERYLLALQKAPENGVWWMGLGISLQAENRLPEAKESFNRARESNSLTPELLAFVESKLQQLQR